MFFTVMVVVGCCGDYDCYGCCWLLGALRLHSRRCSRNRLCWLLGALRLHSRRCFRNRLCCSWLFISLPESGSARAGTQMVSPMARSEKTNAKAIMAPCQRQLNQPPQRQPRNQRIDRIGNTTSVCRTLRRGLRCGAEMKGSAPSSNALVFAASASSSRSVWQVPSQISSSVFPHARHFI